MDGLLAETASRLFADHVTPKVLAEAERGVFPAALWEAITAAGLPLALVPEAEGGFGVPVVEALSLLRLAGAAACPAPLAETMLAGWMLAGAGLAIPDGILGVASGDALSLVRAGERWHLSGTAHAVVWGRDAAAVAVLAMAEGQPHVALVAAGGWTVRPGANLAAEPRDTLVFDASVAARPGLSTLDLRAAGAVTRTLMIAGALERVCDMTVGYAMDRSQFGKPIGRFQAVQQNLAILADQAAAASAAADMAAEAFAEGMRLPTIAAAKARAGEAGGIGAAIAHQVHGAIGFTHEHSLHLLTRRLYAWRDEYGGETEWQALLGRHVAALGPERLWAAIAAL